jgi:hypothetical protein
VKIIDKIKKLSVKYKSYDDFLIWLIKSTFIINLAIDPSNKGVLNYDDFFKIIVSHVSLNHQEVYTIFRNCYVDSTQTQLSMKSLWKLVGGS